MLFLFHCHISSALRGIRQHLLYWMLPNGPSMHCGPRYRHYNDICFLFKVQPFPCGKTRLQITVFRMCGIPCESWHNVFPCLYSKPCPQYCCAQKQRSTSDPFHSNKARSIWRLTIPLKSLSHLAGISISGREWKLKPCRFFKSDRATSVIHQKILTGVQVFCHLRLLSSTILLPKRYTKNRPRLYNETDLSSCYKKDIPLQHRFSTSIKVYKKHGRMFWYKKHQTTPCLFKSTILIAFIN